MNWLTSSTAHPRHGHGLPRALSTLGLGLALLAGMVASAGLAAPQSPATRKPPVASPGQVKAAQSKGQPAQGTPAQHDVHLPAKVQPGAATKAVPAKSAEAEPLYREKLPNGLQVVVYEDHRSPLLSLNVFVKVGSMYEDERTNGLSHFFEHLFFRGTARRTGEEFKREIESLGGQTNAKTTKDLTQFYINLPAVYAREGLDILADALQNTRLLPSEVEQERKVVMDEFRMALESPGAQAQGALAEMMYTRHPYRLPIIGTEKSLNALRIQDFVEFKKRFYTPGRTVVVIVGDTTPAQIMPAVRELFGSFQGVETPVETFSDEPQNQPRERVERRPQQSAFVLLGFKAPSVRDRPDIYRVDLMTFLLGQGEGALLQERLVEKGKLAQSVTCEFLTQRDPGVITLMAVTQPSRTEKSRQALLEAVEDVRAGRFSDEDLERARNLLMNTYRFGNETNAGKAEGLGFYASIDRLEFALTYLDEVARVTRDDVIAAARRYLEPRSCNVLVVRPPDRRASVDE